MSEPRFPEVEERVKWYLARLRELEREAGRPEGSVRLMAVSKTVPPEKVNAALYSGAALVGENRVQELVAKKNQYSCPKSQIHFIGHLQTNKIRDIINAVSCVESVDSLHLARALSAAAEKAGIQMDCLLEVNIGMEESKSGFSPEGVLEAAGEIAAMPSLTLRGLMAVQPAAASAAHDGRYFRRMEALYRALQAAYPQADTLSMGMTGDFEEAVRCGATIVRIGRGLFGSRDKQMG